MELSYTRHQLVMARQDIRSPLAPKACVDGGFAMMRIVALVVLVAATFAVRAQDGSAASYVCLPTDMDNIEAPSAKHVRVATFNAFLNRGASGALQAELLNPGSPQISAVAEIIQRVRPEILLLNEFDYDPSGQSVDAFRQNYLNVSQNGQAPIDYPYVFVAESNTGIPSGVDFDNADSNGDGDPTNDLNDSYGFGFFPGQFAMVLLSQHPISQHQVRTFQKFLWKDMPGALLPDDPATTEPGDWYSEESLDAFRLSSKSHWDVPIWVDGKLLHVLAAHPTPPVFDDPVIDTNGRRNHDEIRFWADYVGGYHRSKYIYDDNGRRGGLSKWEPFVILGDYNADPFDGDSTNNAIDQLLSHPRIDDSLAPGALGGYADAVAAGQANATHVGNPALDTGDFNPSAPGNLRVDYVLPSKHGIDSACGGMFWPTPEDATYPLVGPGFPVVSSDHHLVWQDLALTGGDWYYKKK
jgi:hypothetical protein